MGGGHIRPLWRLLQAAEAMWPASDEVRGAWVNEIVKSRGAGWKQILLSDPPGLWQQSAAKRLDGMLTGGREEEKFQPSAKHRASEV